MRGCERDGGIGSSFKTSKYGVERRLCVERRPAREQLVEDGSQPIDVGRRADQRRTPAGLLRRHVAGSAHELAATGRIGPIVEPLGQAEIRDLEHSAGGHQDVGRLQVAVNDSALVGGVNGPCQGLDQMCGVTRLQCNARESLRQALTVDILQGKEGTSVLLAHFVDLDDVGVLHPRQQFPLSPEPGQVLGAGVFARQDHLERDQPVETNLSRLVDNPHPAAPQLTEELVAFDTESVAGLCRGEPFDPVLRR